MSIPPLLAVFSGNINPPDANATAWIIVRWVHFVAAIIWIGLLYFFNLVNVPFLKELDAPTRGKVIPCLCLVPCGGSAWPRLSPYWLD